MDRTQDLFKATETGDLDKIENILAENSELIETVNNENLTPLAAALYSGQPDALQFLINSGAKLDVPGRNGKTTLEWAREQEPSCETAADLLLTDYMDRIYNTAVWWKKREERVSEGKEKLGPIDLDANCDSCGCIINHSESTLLTLDEALSTEKYREKLVEQAVRILPPEQSGGTQEELAELITKQIRENNMSSTYMVCNSCRDKLFSETVFGKNRSFILDAIEKLFKDKI